MMKLILVVFFFSFFAAAQSKSDPEKIKANNIRTATKISTDLRVSEHFSPKIQSTLKYNENGLQTEYIKYDNNGNIEINYHYKYDDRGNTIEVIGLKADGSLGNRWAYEHDENNNLVRQTSFRPDGQVGREYIFSYDEKGIRLSELVYDNKQLIEQSEFIYEFYDSVD